MSFSEDGLDLEKLKIYRKLNKTALLKSIMHLYSWQLNWKKMNELPLIVSDDANLNSLSEKSKRQFDFHFISYCVWPKALLKLRLI